MRTIIAGSRQGPTMLHLLEAIAKCGWSPSVVICGGAKGADTLGAEWTLTNSIPIEYYYPEWEKFGRAAGMIRNSIMRDKADALIALWDGISSGTANMINIAKRKGLIVYVQLI